MSEEIKTNAEITDEELDEVAGGKSSKKKASKTKYKCLECQKGTHIGHADNGSYIYKANGNEGYCKNGHHWSSVGQVYDRYDPVGAKKWFSEHR